MKVPTNLILLFCKCLIIGLAFGSTKTSWLVKNEQKFNGKPQVDVPEIVESKNGIVAADDRRCSEVGALMLRLGGHAVDAAVATAVCVGVVNPMASGIGGGAFMVVRSATTSEALAFDMRETAPSAAFENMYDSNHEAKLSGPLSMGVPGELAGLHEAWKKFGRLSWKTLFEPSIQFAEKGFEVFPYLEKNLLEHEDKIRADPGLRQVFAPNEKLLKTNDVCYNLKLAKSLKAIAEQGPQALYNGSVGKKLVKDVREAGGILTEDDLRNHKVKVTNALEADVMGFKILGMPPPSSGTLGMTLILKY